MDNDSQNIQTPTINSRATTPTAQASEPTIIPVTDVVINPSDSTESAASETPQTAPTQTSSAQQEVTSEPVASASPKEPEVPSSDPMGVATPPAGSEAVSAPQEPSDKPSDIAATPADPKAKSKLFSPKVLAVVGILVIIAGAAVFFLIGNKDDTQTASGTENNDVLGTQQYENESAGVLDALSKIMLVDSSQQPTIARVEKPEDLKKTNADFYKDVQVGDYVVLYTERAIIFRKTENKVINFAPIVKSSDKDKSNDSNQ